MLNGHFVKFRVNSQPALSSRVVALLKTFCVKRLMHVKSVEAQTPHVGMVCKFGEVDARLGSVLAINLRAASVALSSIHPYLARFHPNFEGENPEGG
ncbi:hypothetical protein TNCV_2857981 [Trichonephila clavipes]|nr:hypothetical protein TNCV_2857981 [Trichonephila clavipes]